MNPEFQVHAYIPILIYYTFSYRFLMKYDNFGPRGLQTFVMTECGLPISKVRTVFIEIFIGQLSVVL